MRKERGKRDPVWTQKDLANRASLSLSDVQAYENGTAQLEQKKLDALEKALGVKLRGSAMGQPKFGPKKKN